MTDFSGLIEATSRGPTTSFMDALKGWQDINEQKDRIRRGGLQEARYLKEQEREDKRNSLGRPETREEAYGYSQEAGQAFDQNQTAAQKGQLSMRTEHMKFAKEAATDVKNFMMQNNLDINDQRVRARADQYRPIFDQIAQGLGKQPTNEPIDMNALLGMADQTEQEKQQSQIQQKVGEYQALSPLRMAEKRQEAEILPASAKANADATVQAARISAGKDIVTNEMKMADDYRTQSKDFKAVTDAYSRVKEALKTAHTSAGSTLTAATSFMKLLDPGSVVRESELGMALSATGAWDRAMNYFNTLQHGDTLTKAQAQDFNNIADKVMDAAKTVQQQVDTNYKQTAGRYGFDERNILQDFGQNKLSTAPGAGAGGFKGWAD